MSEVENAYIIGGEFSIEMDLDTLSEEQEAIVVATFGEHLDIVDLIKTGLERFLVKLGHEKFKVSVEQVE